MFLAFQWFVFVCPWSGLSLCLSGLVCSGCLFFLSVHLSIWSGLVWCGLIWSGLVWCGLVWSGLVCLSVYLSVCPYVCPCLPLRLSGLFSGSYCNSSTTNVTRWVAGAIIWPHTDPYYSFDLSAKFHCGFLASAIVT